MTVIDFEARAEKRLHLGSEGYLMPLEKYPSNLGYVSLPGMLTITQLPGIVNIGKRLGLYNYTPEWHSTFDRFPESGSKWTQTGPPKYHNLSPVDFIRSVK